MDLNLMIIGRKILADNAFDLGRFAVLLADKDHEIAKIVYVDDGEDVAAAVARLAEDIPLAVCGDADSLREALGAGDENDKGDYFTVEGRVFVPMPKFDENVVRNVVIPLLNAKSKTVYNTVVFKTYGKSENELRELLGKLIKNRNRIAFSFPANDAGRDVRVRYSRSTPSSSVTELIGSVAAALGDCVYALKDVSLAGQVARRLISSGKKLSIAESFTGGGLAAALVASPGMSGALLESVVCYSNEAKMRRLGVPESVLAAYGAVSADTAFEMANGLLADPLCDIAVATTGNAGPTAERDGRTGLYYIAIGDRKAIHVFEQFYEPSAAENKTAEEIRKEITDAGIRTALYELGKYLQENSQENPNG